MTTNQRVPYQEIKFLVLSAYYDFCRDRAIGMKWSHDQILGSVAYEYENVFVSPRERFMLCVVQLVMSGGWYKEIEEAARKWISEQIAEKGVEIFLDGIPLDEAALFRRDLELLKII